MSISLELQKIADKLTPYENNKIDEVDRLITVIEKISKSFSGSWLGYHSRVYYRGFNPPPAGAVFSPEWGLMDVFSMGSVGDWVEYQHDYVIKYINHESKNIGLKEFINESNKANAVFDVCKSDALSIIYSNKNTLGEDKFLTDLIEKIEKINVIFENQFISFCRPHGQLMSRDMNALTNGVQTPPHIAVLCKAMSIKAPYTSCEELRSNLIRLANHIKNKEKKSIIEGRIGVNIFIGHGRSHMWRELKDFVQEKLRLPYDEFNRVPVAGVTNITRLAQMLDQACMAFLIMTAEDELMDGNKQARMNVIHEVGLFQGRLGFERAIVLLEDGCEEFTNINGLGQIRFPKGNISAVFQDIREVLERENILK
ncbi:TIR domain-containing protein [Dickeya dianthicola]|uniref:TIR domain-containing protein n=1 Tax=Dickeya dianthicola TaxID=204039 RepID=UPI0003A36922|nr:TIR domain-containing protein [Dickeya dianthicola]MCI4031467.1 nucleotide-binding protein [Dickeya dianthicola]MCI4174607.1 nucleotide-binding protein [Dickeya dianthicola]MCI4179533.1 nucleotide-binding protein [Dickeya dianthicola]MCI4180360.1 nucleotide-binding protein [Dickeya dianthicola]MCI4194041.1 nucleotide-binding protein [Dickeya dianthicola]